MIEVKATQDELRDHRLNNPNGLKGFTYKVYKDRQDVRGEPPIYDGAYLVVEDPDDPMGADPTTVWLQRWPIQDVYTITGGNRGNTLLNQSIIQNIR